MNVSLPFREGGERFFRQNDQRLPLLYLSFHFAVIAKPAGMGVYPSKSNPQHKSVEDYLQPQKRGGPWLVHRLDHDTAGCLLIARRKTALIAAQTLFSAPKTNSHLKKNYWAILDGELKKQIGEEGEINFPLHKIRQQHKWFMQAYTEKKAPPPSLQKNLLPAKTKWKILGKGQGKTWLELELITGRTHQARVHCQTLGAAILGDPLYTSRDKGEQNTPLCLLARTLFLALPSGEKIQATMPPPAFMLSLLKQISPEFPFKKE
ncbi:RNA pseudouridine synthase [Acetobacteraceae bacterium]|nr:RNA pseudouridine synthase [Acetobacteraceae bacterium]